MGFSEGADREPIQNSEHYADLGGGGWVRSLVKASPMKQYELLQLYISFDGSHHCFVFVRNQKYQRPLTSSFATTRRKVKK